MATSAFKSTTKRAALGASTSDDSSRAGRRSRSLSRFSRPIEPPLDVPREIVANAQFPEISLDDLALELFSSSSSVNENGSDGGVRQRKERQGRSVSRLGDVGRWASDTASSSRKSRSVSRTRGHGSTAAAVSEKKVNSSDSGPRRRRSQSVSRRQSEVSRSQSSSKWVDARTPIHGNGHLAPMSTASSNRRLGRTQSHKDFSMLHDGYSSHSSALTDDETKDTLVGNNGYEKIIRPVYAQKKPEHPTEDVASGGLYEVMKQELRYAVEEIRTELNHAMGINQTENSHHDFSGIRRKHSTKPEQPDKLKQDILNDMLLEEQHEWGSSRIVNELPDSRSSAAVQRPSRARKRSSDRYRVSNKLTEEAQRYFEGFISNVEDTDISSFDGERSDESSTLGGTRARRDSTIRTAETYKSSAESNSCPGEMDGVILPWLHWETAHDGQSPITPESRKWYSDKDMASPDLFSSAATRETAAADASCHSCYDLDRYLSLKMEEELVFEVYKERNRMNAGGILLCGSSVLW